MHTKLGRNHRMTSLQAALGSAQLAHVEDAVRRRREIGAQREPSAASEATALAVLCLASSRQASQPPHGKSDPADCTAPPTSLAMLELAPRIIVVLKHAGLLNAKTQAGKPAAGVRARWT